MNRSLISYTILGLLYGLFVWFQNILLKSYINKNFSDNLIGLDFKITQSNIKSLLFSFIITCLYTMRDYYEFSK